MPDFRQEQLDALWQLATFAAVLCVIAATWLWRARQPSDAVELRILVHELQSYAAELATLDGEYDDEHVSSRFMGAHLTQLENTLRDTTMQIAKSRPKPSLAELRADAMLAGSGLAAALAEFRAHGDMPRAGIDRLRDRLAFIEGRLHR